MPKKPKKPTPPPTNPGAFKTGLEDDVEHQPPAPTFLTDEEITKRNAESRELSLAIGRSRIKWCDDQAKLAFAQRFAAFAAAAKDLATQGSFPAIDDIRNQLLRELTVMGRELHEARLA